MKTKLILLLVLFLATIKSSIAFQEMQDHKVLFEKAKYTMETKANLKEAINLFESLIKTYPNQNEYVAKALLYQGMCYEKLGNQEAVKKYQQLVDNYPGQKSEVALARERLSKLLVVEKELEIPLVPKFTKIQIPVKLARGAQLSRDGKTLTFSSTRYEGSIWTIPIPGKVGADIAGKPEKLIGEDKVWVWGHAWSADGKWIAYNYMKNDKEKDIFVDEVHIISSIGGEPKKIALPVNRGGSYQLFQYSLSLSPDGKVLAYASKEEGKSDKPKESYIYTIPVNGGVAERLTDSGTWLPAFSPDGKKIAYMKKSAEEDALWVIPAFGGTPVKVSDLGGEVQGPPIWSPDSDMIAFLLEPKPDEKCKEIWLVSLSEEGSATAPPLKIELLLESSMNLAGWTGENKVGLLLLNPEQQAIYTIPSSGGKATQITPGDGNASFPRWKPDGKKIYFIYKDNLSSVSAEGGEISTIPITGMESIMWICVSPDGKKVLFHGNKKGVAGMHIWTVPIEGGEPTQIIQSPLSDAFPTWSPDGKTISFLRQEKTADGNSVKTSLCIISAEGDNLRVLVPDPVKLKSGPHSMCWSPDSKSIVYYCKEDGKIKTIPIDNGESEVLAELHKGDQDTWITFSPDGKKILYTANKKIWIISLDGGEPVEIKTGLDTQPVNLTWAPDGEKIAFTIRKGGDIDLWLMEDFLPLEKLAQKEEAKDLLIRKVLGNTEIEPLGTISPDGRYISFVDWAANSNLSIVDLKTKARKCITDFKKEDEQAYYSIWSPDGKRLAFSWWEMGDKDFYNISILDATGNNSKKLFTSDKVNWIELGNWSADGKYILATLSLNDIRECQIVRISTEDGSKQILKTVEKPYLGGKPLFSPDGRYIAYDIPDEKVSGNSDIYIYSMDDERENVLFKHPAHDYILGWTQDGNSILFASDRKGTVDAMIVPVNEGKTTGQPKTVKSNIGSIVPMGFTKDNKFYYGDWPGQRNVFSAEIDIENGKTIKKPTLLINRFEGRNGTPSYSNNGKYLAYISKRGIVNKGKSETVLCIKDLETGIEDVIFPPNKIAGSVSYPTWSPDDNKIALMCRKGGRQTISQFNIPERIFTPLISEAPDQAYYTDNIYPQWSGDGKTLYYLQISEDSDVSRILARNLDTGKDKELFRYTSDNFMDRCFNIKISPDKKWLSAINRSEKRILNLISSNDGQLKHLHSFDFKGGASSPQVWSKDGKYIIYPYITKDNRWNLMRIPVDGGEKMTIELGVIGISSPSLHPDGRTLTFSSAGYSLPKNNIWVMENFLPEAENK